MSHDAIAALDMAITQLEAELAADPRFALLSSLRQARVAYGNSTGSLSIRDSSDQADEMHTPIIAKPGRSRPDAPKLAPGRAQAYEICKDALVGHLEPLRTRELYELVEENGVNLPGGMNNLSSMLGRHPTVFKSHGRAGWTLKAHGNGAEPNSGANGEGPAPLFDSSQKGGEINEATTTH